ncbi:MAG: gliding motility-associated ABC transporter substrate-binding protein GldG [Paludibacteraceae bacterium]|nr:gliding motility-associated ABC transporter substrate-binding protein GldG [Paludibacteraceae bacterium]
MLVLLRKEIASFFASATGVVVIGIFLLLTGVFLWVLPVETNVLNSGYANLDGLFSLAPWLYLFLIPALTMRMFPDEFRSGTMELLLTRPVSRMQIVLAKYFAGVALAVLSLLPTLVYFLTVCWLGAPAYNMDFGGFWGSFLGLVLLAMVYVSIGIFASTLSDNPVVAFLVAALFCYLSYQGFEWIALLFDGAHAQDMVSRMGIAYHYESMSRGVIDLRDLAYFLTVIVLFLCGAFLVFKGKPTWRFAYVLGAVLAFDLLAVFFFFRLDLTSEKRYTLSPQTRSFLKQVEEPVDVTVYLEGDLNMGFLRLKKSTADMLTEMKVYANKDISVTFVNPAQGATDEERNAHYAELQAAGLTATMVHDRDREGRQQQKVVFPWLRMMTEKDTVNVLLLKNIAGNSGDENLNVSIENLEYGLIDALRRLTNKHPLDVAFLEGHGELPEQYVSDISEQLSQYYNVHRGALGTDVDALDPFKVLIVARPLKAFSETDKFIIDQYIMRGGRVLWLVDGVSVDAGTAIANDVKISDMLFTYGVRIDPVLLSDVQCSYIPLLFDDEEDNAEPQMYPWYYSPLLTLSPYNVITKNIAPVEGQFVSAIDFVGEDSLLRREVLMATSAHTGVESVPCPVSFEIVELSGESSFFANAYVPVACLQEGSFRSVFANRMVPKEMNMKGRQIVAESAPTRMIVVADGDLIANDYESGQPLPLGYNKYMGRQFGNGDFVLNAVNYLADDEGWMSLRGRSLKLRLLDKTRVSVLRNRCIAFNLGLPLLLLIIFSVGYQLVRKNIYKR